MRDEDHGNPFGKILLTFFMTVALAWGTACSGQAPPGSAEKGHEAQKEHAGEGGHGDERAIRLTEAQRKEFVSSSRRRVPARSRSRSELPGEIVPNADRVAHVVPRVPGVVREVRKVLGDHVRKGEILLVLDSKELADNKAAFLSAREKLDLAQSNYDREEDLWKKKISPTQDYLQAKQALTEARIELRSAEQKLHALGFSDAYLAQLPSQPDVSYIRYEVIAPFDGVIIEKHVALGEAHKEDAEIVSHRGLEFRLGEPGRVPEGHPVGPGGSARRHLGGARNPRHDGGDQLHRAARR